MRDVSKSKIPFKKDSKVSVSEVKNYLNIFIEEYRNITSTDLPESVCEMFPFWQYPVRVIAAITPSNVYVFISRDGNPSENQIEVNDESRQHRLGKIMDALADRTEEVARVLGVKSAISCWFKEARKDSFDDSTARLDAFSQVKSHYEALAAKKQIEPRKFADVELPEYTPPLSFLSNHMESDELKCRIERMLESAKREIMIAGWLDTSLLNLLTKKHKEGVLIRIVTKVPGKESPQPTRTAYTQLVGIARVRRNNLQHFRVIVCDSKEVLVTSSDLTTHSLTQNFEAGVWRAIPIAVQRAIELFETVWRHKETKDVNEEMERAKPS